MSLCKNGSKQLFLTRKRNKQRTIKFNITKNNRHKPILHKLIPLDDNSFETVSETSEFKSSSTLLNQITFPEFFNDKQVSTVDLQETLERYEKVCDSFNDNEEVELYLVRKESVLSNNIQ